MGEGRWWREGGPGGSPSFLLLRVTRVRGGGVLCGMRPLLLGLLVTAIGCGGPTVVRQSVALGAPFLMAPGETVLLDGATRTLRFIGVQEDSRCPTDALVLCAWAGSATVRMATGSVLADESIFDLHSGEQPHARDVGGFLVELDGVLPEARLEPPIAPEAYRVRIVVTRP